MNKLTKSAGLAAVSFVAAGGAYLMEANVNDRVTDQRQECLREFEGEEEQACLDGVEMPSLVVVSQALEIMGAIGAFALGRLAYQTLRDEQ